MNYYIVEADLNSLYHDKFNAPVIVGKVATEEEAKAEVDKIQNHETAAWYQTWNCEDSHHRWDSDDPCLSMTHKLD